MAQVPYGTGLALPMPVNLNAWQGVLMPVTRTLSPLESGIPNQGEQHDTMGNGHRSEEMRELLCMHGSVQTGTLLASRCILEQIADYRDGRVSTREEGDLSHTL